MDDINSKEMIERTYWQTRYLALDRIVFKNSQFSSGMMRTQEDRLRNELFEAQEEVLKTL